MNKKDILIVCVIIAAGALVAFLINLALTYGNLITTNLSNDTWLSFWGSYCGGLFAIVVGYFAIVHSNRNTEKTILQQNHILEYQQKVQKLNEYSTCLCNNLELLNTVEAREITATMDFERVAPTKTEIMKKRAQIFTCDLRYRFLFEVDLGMMQTEIEKAYNDCWIACHTEFAELLTKQFEVVHKIEENQRDYQAIKSQTEIISSCEHIIEISKTPEQRQEYQVQLSNAKREKAELQDKSKATLTEVGNLIDNARKTADSLLLKNKNLLDLSILLMREKEQRMLGKVTD